MAAVSNNSDFTVRDLNRQLARVLEACDRLGIIRIRSRKGRTYELRPQPDPKDETRGYPDFAARRKAMGMPKMTRQQSEMLDKLIAGE